MAMRVASAAGKSKAGQALALAAAGYGASQTAEASAPRHEEQQPDALLRPDEQHVEQAVELLVDAFKTSVDDGALVVSQSADGTEWVDVPRIDVSEQDPEMFMKLFQQTVRMGAAAAKDPEVHKLISKKIQQQGRLGGADSLLDGPEVDEEEGSLVESELVGEASDAGAEERTCEVCGQSFVFVLPGDDSSASFARCCGAECLSSENQRLTAENEELRARLFPAADAPPAPDATGAQAAAAPVPAGERKQNDRPAVARVQALARGVLARQSFYRAWEASQRPRVAVRLQPRLDADGRPEVGLSLVPLTRAGRPPKTRKQKEAPRTAVIITAAIIVGVLAFVIAKNPASARIAAAGAAASVAALIKPKARS